MDTDMDTDLDGFLVSKITFAAWESKNHEYSVYMLELTAYTSRNC